MAKQYHGKVFYGWYIVLAGLLTMGAGWGVFTNCASLFIRPVTEELGFTRQAYSLNMSIVSLCTMFSTLVVGKVFEKFGMLLVMRVSCLVASASFFCYSLFSTIPLFYLSSVILGLSLSFFTMVPMSILMSNWFYERRGLAVGITFMGSGLGGMVFNPIANYFITNFGWRSAFQVLAVCSLLLLVPAIFFIFRVRPQDMGLEPLGAEKVVQTPEGQAAAQEGTSYTDAVKSPLFWLLCLFAACASTTGYTLMQFVAPHLADIGYSTSFAAAMVSLCMGMLAVGKIVLGWLYDRLGTRMATVLSVGCILLGLGAMLFAQVPAMLILVVAGSSLGCAFGSVAHPIITQNIYGRREYGSIFGLISASSSLGTAASPLISGTIFDMTGSYYLLFASMAALSAVLMVGYFLILSTPAADRYR